MTVFSSMSISASGLTAERVRVNAAASNLANAHTTRTVEGGPYRRMDPILTSVGASEGAGVMVSGMRRDESQGQLVYMPEHPDANGDGFVTLPNVDPVHEIVNLVSAQRGFEANASAFETAKALAEKALDLLR
jgi:flagellar basal-body rod protein FlgC